MIHVDRRELTAILQRACRVANGQVAPGGGAVHVSVDAQHLRVCSTNYEQSITEVLPALCANGDAAGTVCPDARAVLSCVKGLPSSTTEVILGVDAHHLAVGQARLKTLLPPEEYPVLPAYPKRPALRLELPENTKQLLRFLLPAVSKARSRYALNALCFDFREGLLVACDGSRLHAAPLGQAFDAEKLLVPLLTFRLGTPTHLVIPEQRNHTFFDTANGYIASYALEGEYPEYMCVVRDTHTTHCTVRKADLLSALNQVRSALSAESQSVELGIGSPMLITPAHLRGKDRWSIDIEAVSEGEDGHACLDARYLADVIKNLPAKLIGINYTAPAHSLEFVSDTSDAWAIIMPITQPTT